MRKAVAYEGSTDAPVICGDDGMQAVASLGEMGEGTGSREIARDVVENFRRQIREHHGLSTHVARCKCRRTDIANQMPGDILTGIGHLHQRLLCEVTAEEKSNKKNYRESVKASMMAGENSLPGGFRGD